MASRKLSSFPLVGTPDGSETLVGIKNGDNVLVQLPHIPTAIASAVAEANAYTDTKADWTKYGVWHGREFNVAGGVGVDETQNIMAAIAACGLAGGGTVYIRATAPTDPIYIDGAVQIEYNNVRLVYESPLLYGPSAMQRINGGLAETIRTELGQVQQIKLRADAYVDVNNRMVLPLRVGDGAFLVVGDRITLRGENDVTGKALYKQTTTVYSITGDDVVCSDEMEYDFLAVYPDSDWPSDWTTGTTVAINVYSPATADFTVGSFTVNIASSDAFVVGDYVYVSDTRTEADFMAPEVTTLRSAAQMEIARIVSKTATTVTFDRALKRTHLLAWKASISKIDAVRNSHIETREITWAAPQPNRRNAALAINYGINCTIQTGHMDGRAGRVGIGVRVAYSYGCHVFNSKIYDAYSYNSAEGYGIAIYYSTYCSAYKNEASGGRHNFLLQTATCCDVIENISNDDYISGIDLHGANSVACRILKNRISRSVNHSPGVTNGGAIRNGNTSHCLGDHQTLISGNWIEGYLGSGSSAIDLSPSSNDVIITDNDVVDSQIGVRHYNVGSGIVNTQYTNRVVIDGNRFTRVVQPTYIRNWTNSVWTEVVFCRNKSIQNSTHFKIEDIPNVHAYQNEIIDPIDSAQAYAFNFENVANLRVFGNIAGTANRGVRVVNCGNTKVIRNFLSDVTEAYPIFQTGNTTFVEAGNDDTGGGGGGTPVEFQTTATHVQWRNVGDLTWNDLVALSSLSGTDGIDGLQVELQATATHIQWRYTTDVAWTNLIALDSLSTPLPATPRNRRIGILGDSITAQCSSTTNGLENYGYLSNALRAADYRFIFDPLLDNYGIGGDTTTQAMVRIPNVIASGVGTCIVACGTNDRTSAMTANDTIDNLRSMRDDLIAAGIHVIMVVPLPRGDSTYTDKRLSAEQLGHAHNVRRRILEEMEKPGCWVVDTWPLLADLAVSTGDIKLGYTHDGLHPNPLGAYWMGQAIAEVMKKVLAAEPILPLGNFNYYHSTENPFGIVTTNPMMAGTTGSWGTGGSGQLADGYTGSNATGTTGVTRAYSKVTTATGDWQQCVVGGVAATSNAAIDIGRQIGLAGSIVPGGIYEAVCEFEYDADITNVLSFQFGLHMQDATTTVVLWDGDRYTNTWKLPNVVTRGIMRTPRIVAPAAPTDVRVRLSCYLATDGAPTGTFRFRKFALRRVG